MFEALNAVISGSSRGLTQAISSIAEAAESAGDAALQGAIEFGQFEDAVGAVSDDAVGAMASLRAFRSEVDDVGDEATESAGSLGVFEGMLGGLGAVATAVSAPLTLLQDRIDETGEESLLAAFSTTGLSISLDSLGLSAFAATSGIAALESVLTGLIIVLGVVAVAIVGVVGALTGLAAAAGAATAALGALFLGGLLPVARDIKQTGEDITSIWGGFEKILEQVANQAAAALEPLEGVSGFEDLALGALEGAVQLLAMAAQTAANLAPTLRPIARRFGAIVDAVSPQIFGELQRVVRDLTPLLANIAGGVLRSIPGALRVVSEAAKELGPDIANLGESIGGVLPELVTLGVDIARVVVPALAAFIEILDAALSVVVPIIDFFDPLIELFGQLFDAVTFFARALEMALHVVGQFIDKWVTDFFGSGVSGDILDFFNSLDTALLRTAQAFAFAVENAKAFITTQRAIDGNPAALAKIASGEVEVQTELPEMRPGTTPTEYAVSEAGGAAAPTDPTSGTNAPPVNIEINVDGQGDPQQTGRKVEKAVEEALKRQRLRQTGTR